MIKAVIFDLDGTLLDSEPLYYKGDKIFLAGYGVELTPEMKREFTGIGSGKMIALCKERYNIPGSIEQLSREKNEIYMEIARKEIALFPEMGKLLQALKKTGMPMVIASGSSLEVMDELVPLAGIEEYFLHIFSADQVSRGKPHPDLFLKAARALKAEPENCLVLEDSRYGVEAALAARMECAAIPSDVTDPLPSVFYKAGLLFEKGMAQFTAAKLLEWIKKH